MYLNSQNLAVLEGGQVTRALEKYIEKGETGAIGACVTLSLFHSLSPPVLMTDN